MGSLRVMVQQVSYSSNGEREINVVAPTQHFRNTYKLDIIENIEYNGSDAIVVIRTEHHSEWQHAIYPDGLIGEVVLEIMHYVYKKREFELIARQIKDSQYDDRGSIRRLGERALELAKTVNFNTKHIRHSWPDGLKAYTSYIVGTLNQQITSVERLPSKPKENHWITYKTNKRRLEADIEDLGSVLTSFSLTTTYP